MSTPENPQQRRDPIEDPGLERIMGGLYRLEERGKKARSKLLDGVAALSLKFIPDRTQESYKNE